jgi:putative nucleotidyltransferase with HDIG domain
MTNEAARRALPIVLLVLAAAVAGFLSVLNLSTVPGDEGLWVAVALAAVAVGTDSLSFGQRRKNSSGSVALIPLGASLLCWPDWRGLLLGVSASAVMQLVHRRDVLKAVFNCSQAALGLGIGLLAYRSLGGPAFAVLDGVSFPRSLQVAGAASLALLGSAVVVNQLCVSAVIASVTGQKFVTVLSKGQRAALGMTLVHSVVTFYLAWLSINLGFFGAIGVALPILALKQLSQTTVELTSVTEELLDLMVAAIEARDPYTSGHSKRVAAAARIIAKAIGLRPEQVERVEVAALLHDVGKIDEQFARILAKEGRLTPDEWETMKRHPGRSAELVGMLSSLKDIVPAVRHHHENWDGTGYPDGVRAENIPLASRIIMFADTLDAITTDRPYRKALSPEEARREFIKFRGKQFDPWICDVVVATENWEALYRVAQEAKEEADAASGKRTQSAAVA